MVRQRSVRGGSGCRGSGRLGKILFVVVLVGLLVPVAVELVAVVADTLGNVLFVVALVAVVLGGSAMFSL